MLLNSIGRCTLQRHNESLPTERNIEGQQEVRIGEQPAETSLTDHNDLQRTGANKQETVLTPSAPTSGVQATVGAEGSLGR
jgi:hypothetical protein